MLFDIFNYNLHFAISSFVLFFIFFAFIFKRFITSYADPLVFHILWLSSQATFFVIYIERFELSLFYMVFTISFVVYVGSLFIFLHIYALRKKNAIRSGLNITASEMHISLASWRTIVTILFFLVLYSNRSFFEYAVTCQSPSELFLFRFVNLQGRDFLERILGSANYFLYLFLFYGIHKGIGRNIAYSVLLFLIFLGLVSGGRSTMLSLVSSVGTYVFYFAHQINRYSIKKINRMAVAFIMIGVLIATFVSSFYEVDSTIETAAITIFNRIFAAPDGVEYYLKYAGDSHIESGLTSYTLSIFGIYVKNILSIDVKNIGWQLTELAVGNVDFAQGSNYTFLLQSVVFSHYFAPVYAAIIAWIVARLRYVYAKDFHSSALYFTLSSLCFIVATDLEYFIFISLTVGLIYLIIVYPVMRVRI